MNIVLNRKTRYAIDAAIDVARHSRTGRRKAREIAEAAHIPPKYVPKILAQLVKLGVLSAQAGPTGGYLLARDADKITLLELIEGMEGRLWPNADRDAHASHAVLDRACNEIARGIEMDLEIRTLDTLLGAGDESAPSLLRDPSCLPCESPGALLGAGIECGGGPWQTAASRS